MTNINPLPYECVPETDTTPDIWGVYPENALLRAQIAKNDELLEELLRTIGDQAHQIRNLNDRIGFNDVMHRNQFNAVSTFFKWIMEHYQIDKQDDIWEMLDGLFEEKLLTDPRKRVYRMQVTRREVDNYEIEFPWDMTEDRSQEILRDATLAGQFTRTDFQNITQLGGVPITVIAHDIGETEWTTWNRGQINNNESPW